MDLPYGMEGLRQKNELTSDSVRCHVQGCETVKKRQREVFRCEDEFLCKTHGIYLSPTTFQYKDYLRNLLWRDGDDKWLLDKIKQTKRTMTRLGRERDEDALTWNIVRAFEKERCLNQLAQLLLGSSQASFSALQEPKVIYWASDGAGQPWSVLEKAQAKFGEQPNRGTEPDAALYWPGQGLIFIETKFCASNRTTPSPRENDCRPTSYGGHRHFPQVFNASYEEIAVKNQRYQLMRIWLLGTWIAEGVGIPFCLVNLTRREDLDKTEHEGDFGRRFCIQNEKRCFVRATWEDIWKALPQSGLSQGTVQLLDRYFRNKSCGYDSQGVLQKAFMAE